MAKKSGMGINVDHDPPPPAADQEAAAEPIAVPADGGVPAEPRPRQDKRPLCPVHEQQMRARSTNPCYTYYKCPVAGCDKTTKLHRPIGPKKNLYGHGKSAPAGE